MTPLRQPLPDILRYAFVIKARHIWALLGVIALFPVVGRAEGFGPAHAGDDGWLPALSMDCGAGAWLAGVGAVYQPGFVPPFRAAERNRLAYGVGGRWMPDRRVQVAVGFDGLWDHSAGGDAAGPGDVRLGTSLLVVDHAPVRAWLGWAAKLPDAGDEGELGSDETDVTFGAGGELHSGPWRLLAGVGLGVWGNPLRFANQDDVPELRLAASWNLRAFDFGAHLDADIGTARNPSRVVVGGWARHVAKLKGRFAYVEIGGGAGLTPAAPDAIAAVSFGFGQPARP